jgi:hypothetical protein
LLLAPPPQTNSISTAAMHTLFPRWVKPGPWGAIATRPLSCRKQPSCRRRHRSEMCHKLPAAISQPLFDHLVGAGKQRRWHGETEHLRGLEVDEQLDLRGLNDRQVGRLVALENPAGVDAGLTV